MLWLWENQLIQIKDNAEIEYFFLLAVGSIPFPGESVWI